MQTQIRNALADEVTRVAGKGGNGQVVVGPCEGIGPDADPDFRCGGVVLVNANVTRPENEYAGLPPKGRGQAGDRILTVGGVASLLQVPRSWVYTRTRSRSKDRLPGLKLGKYWRFWESDILNWLESQRG